MMKTSIITTTSFFISSSIFTKEIKFKAGDDKLQDGLSVAIAKPEAYDIKVTMEPAPELLPTYRLAYYDENAILLPEEYYSMSETSTVISSGAVASAKLPIEFSNIGNLDRNETYVLPITVQSMVSAFCRVLRITITCSAELPW